MNIIDDFSVITIVKGRQAHLSNMIKGIRRSSVIPREVIIVGIGEEPELEDFEDLPLKIYSLDSVAKSLPIGEARNLGASKATTNNLIFLDVDCIPSESFFEQILVQGLANRSLIMGNPRYLLNKIDGEFSQDWLANNSIHHPHRPKVVGTRAANDYMLFWSLAFYIPKSLFELLGGFDTSYTGYGAEDSDLALKLRALPGFRLYLSEATVYHQQHPVYSPPVHQMDAIIRNAEIFYGKWNRWAMDNWLAAFAELGLIKWESEASRISKIAQPSEVLLEQYYKPDHPFM